MQLLQLVILIIINFLKIYIQVLSNSVAEALELENHPGTKETRRFVRTFNRFFDMLNVRSLKEGVFKRQPDKLPYRSVDDGRLKV